MTQELMADLRDALGVVTRFAFAGLGVWFAADFVATIVRALAREAARGTKEGLQ